MHDLVIFTIDCNDNTIDCNDNTMKTTSIKKRLQELLSTLNNNTETKKLNYKTAVYYANDMFGCGKRYIISQSYGNQTRMNTISPSEIKFQMCMSSFVSKLPRSLAIEFGDILTQLKEIYIEGNNPPVCSLPNNYSDLRRIYIDGSAAISKNVPTPIAIMKDKHLFVSLVDCVADFIIRKDNLIFNIDDWDNIINNCIFNKDMNIFGCERCKEIIGKAKLRINEVMLEKILPTIPLLITFWSDDFDPNKSVKNNRQSVWIKTATIFTMDKFGNKIQGTYVLSLSVKKLDHESIENAILLDLEKLRSGKLLMMYSRSNRSLVHVHADVFCVMNDQPERRSNLHLANGNSSVHGYFGIMLDFKKVQNNVRSCNLCSKSIIQEVKTKKIQQRWRSKKCKKCTAWLYNTESKLLHFEPDPQYPNILLKQKNWCQQL